MYVNLLKIGDVVCLIGRLYINVPLPVKILENILIKEKNYEKYVKIVKIHKKINC